MTPRAWFIAGSLALNGACLAAFAFRPAVAPAAVRPFFVRHFHAAPAGPAANPKPGVARPVPRTQLWPALDAGADLTTLVARLRAAGFPPEIVRAMAMAEISARYDARIRGLFEPDPGKPFWQLSSSMFGSGDKRMEQYSALQRERAKIQRELFADPFFATDDITAAQRRQFGSLPKQTIDVLQRIEDDYAEMTAAIRSSTSGIILAEDRQKLELLQRERRADLAGVLTPQELADYEMRSSPLTNMLVRQLGAFNASEAEFRAIFQAQQAYSDRAAANALGSSGNFEERQAAYQQLNAQLKAGLGDTRYTDYMRETDRNYQQLLRLAERENIIKETALRAYNTRDIVAQESNRIADDPALSVEEKRAALKSLGDRTRVEILGILGPNAGPTYVKVVEQAFLRTVERGNAVTFDSLSGSMSMSMGSGAGMGLPVTAAFGANPSYRNVAQPPRPTPSP